MTSKWPGPSEKGPASFFDAASFLFEFGSLVKG